MASALAGTAVAQPDRGRSPFPIALGVEAKWESFLAGPPAAVTIQSLLQEDAEGRNVVGLGDGVHASMWAAVDRLATNDPDTLTALRLLEDSEAAMGLAAARRSGGRDRLLAVCRRYPWAAASHAALLDCGDAMLRSGHVEKDFEYVKSRAKDVKRRQERGLGEQVGGPSCAQPSHSYFH
jgi:hypothetical protein